MMRQRLAHRPAGYRVSGAPSSGRTHSGTAASSAPSLQMDPQVYDF